MAAGRFIAFPLAVILVAFGSFYAWAAGTINLSLSQQFDALGRPLSGCKLYFYQAGTTMPQNAYSDTNLSIALPNPLECDASGRLQQFFLADGSIKIRLADKNGATVLAADGLLVIGPSAGGGGGSSVDATAIYQTGDLKVRYGTGAHSGWVRTNGRTIGSATSGAAERANSDVQALWEYLCTNDTALRATISGGYSGNCNTDWLANKTIQLPDYRGMAIAGLDDMGNSSAGRLTASYFGTAATTLGASGGSEYFTIAQGNLPSVNLTTTIVAGQGSHNHTGTANAYPKTSGGAGTGGLSVQLTGGTAALTIDAQTLPQMTGTTPLGGSGTAIARVPPMRLSTIYIKL